MSGDEQAETVDVKETRQLVAAGEAMVIDVRDDVDWTSERIPGSSNFDPSEVGQRVDELPKDQRLLIVCERGDERSRKVAAELRERGYDAAVIEGGMEAWREENLPMQPSTDLGDEG
jgi:rhodanese-related sulfurtransferase